MLRMMQKGYLRMRPIVFTVPPIKYLARRPSHLTAIPSNNGILAPPYVIYSVWEDIF